MLLTIEHLKKGIFTSKTKYAKEMLIIFQMDGIRSMGKPMETSSKLGKDEDSPCEDKNLYSSMIDSLLYLTTSRPNIIKVFCLTHFQGSPKTSHMNFVKIFLRYVNITITYGLWYPRHENLIFHAYTHADWASCLDDRKRTSCGACFIGGKLVSWHSKKK
jgi:hypothetical protein